jgi:signal recognition particle subunit SRP54
LSGLGAFLLLFFPGKMGLHGFKANDLMFESLGRRLGDIFDQLRRKKGLTEADVTAALRHIRIALLEADVALPAITALLDDVKAHVVGTAVLKSIAPDQMIIKAVHEGLIRLLDHSEQAWILGHKKPSIFLMAGLQGSGKTTMSAKIAWLFKARKVLMASLDIYRPAAQKQLEILGQSINVDTLPIIEGQAPLDIARRALLAAESYDILIVDTAGRLHIDDTMMQELHAIKELIQPDEVLLVIDALSGQDGLTTAKHFHQNIGITGVGLSRVDGDGRGGVALSLRYATGCPIKVMGMGEHPSQVMLFEAKRLADRILDKGDIVGLVEKAQVLAESVNQEAQMKRMQSGIFTLEDVSTHLKQLESLGGLKGVLGFLPGMRGIKEQLEQHPDRANFKQHQAIISSMTPTERRRPELLNASRKRRIALGSGADVAAVNRLLDQFFQMQKMMKSFKQQPPRKGFRS